MACCDISVFTDIQGKGCITRRLAILFRFCRIWVEHQTHTGGAVEKLVRRVRIAFFPFQPRWDAARAFAGVRSRQETDACGSRNNIFCGEYKNHLHPDINIKRSLHSHPEWYIRLALGPLVWAWYKLSLIYTWYKLSLVYTFTTSVGLRCPTENIAHVGKVTICRSSDLSILEILTNLPYEGTLRDVHSTDPTQETCMCYIM